MSLLCASWAISFGNEILTTLYLCKEEEEEAGSVVHEIVLADTLYIVLVQMLELLLLDEPNPSLFETLMDA